MLQDELNPNNVPRANKSWKWKNILSNVWKEHRKLDDEEVGSGIIPGCRVLLQRNGNCCQIKKMGKGLYLGPHPTVQAGDGIFIQPPSLNLFTGKGLQRKHTLLNILI